MVIGIDCSRAFVAEPTGTENYSRELVKQLLRLPASRKHEMVLFIRPRALIPGWVKQKGVQVQEIRMRYLWTQVGLAVVTWRKPRLDVLWVPAHTLPLLRRPGLKTVVTIHGLEYRYLPQYHNLLQRWYLPLSTRYAANAATRLISVSKFTKKQLEKEFHTNSKKIKVIYEGGVKRARAKIKLSEKWPGLFEDKYWLFVGSLQPRKNLLALIEAFSLWKKEAGRMAKGVKLVIAGGRGWMTKGIYQAPEEYGVQAEVVFAGRVSEDELSGLYQQAGVYVQPSVTEGFGLPVLEAMAAQVPVVVSDGGALPELVGEEGVIVPLKPGASFAKRLAKGVGKALKNEGRSVKLRAAKRRASEFGWEKAARETLAVLINK